MHYKTILIYALYKWMSNVPFVDVIEPLSVGQSAKDYLSKEVNPTILAGLTELCKKKPGDPVVSNYI